MYKYGVNCPSCGLPVLEFSSTDFRGPVPTRATIDEVCKLSTWFSGIGIDDLADPCQTTFARSSGATTTSVALAVAEVLRGTQGCCGHAVVLDRRLCTALAVGADECGRHTPMLLVPGTVGTVNVVDLRFPVCDANVESGLPKAAMGLLEASPNLPALPYEEFMAVRAWKPGSCKTIAPPLKPWGHVIFISHVWRGPETPGDAADLARAQELVKSYVKEALEVRRAALAGEAPPRGRFGINPSMVKNIEGPQDFGIWIDYMLVPNERADHVGCGACARLRQESIPSISGILTVSTIFKMDPDRVDRGWILHEVTANSHSNVVDGGSGEPVPLEHGHRVRMMMQGRASSGGLVEYSEPGDGVRLRCLEFVRLGQMPRCWPAVNLELLGEYLRTGERDEGTVAAASTLFRYARHFDLPCHELKRMMSELAQEVAAARPGISREPGHFTQPVDLTPLRASIAAQERAMHLLARAVDRPDGPPDLDLVREHDRPRWASVLQLQQFIAVAMGLRAEWLRGEGVACWVRLTALTEALASTKFMARRLGGSVRARAVNCNVRISAGRSIEHAIDVARHGVPAEDLEHVFGLLRS